MRLSIIFPVHNEAGNLSELIVRLNAVLKDYFRITDLKNQDYFELIFVDDASTDESRRILLERAEEFPYLRYIYHEKSRGQTGAFKSGFDAAKGEIIITMDADLEVLPEDVPLFLNKMLEGYDMVNGVRRDRKHEYIVKLQSRIYNVLMRILFRSPFRDNASNFSAFKSALIKNLPLTDNDHRYLYPILRTRGLATWAEVEVAHELRKSGVSKYSRFKAIKNALEMIPAWLRIKTGRYT